MNAKEDPALKQVWDARHHISEKCDFDTEKLIKYYQEKQKQHKNRLVSSSITNQPMLSEKSAKYAAEAGE